MDGQPIETVFWVEGNWGEAWKEKRIECPEGGGEGRGGAGGERGREGAKEEKRKRKRRKRRKKDEKRGGGERIHAANLLKVPLVKSKLTLRLRWHYSGCTATKRLLKLSRWVSKY